MFESTKDILFLILSICLVFFTFFLCYLIFYAVKILKRFDQLVEEIKERFERLHRKVESGFNYLGIVTEGIKMAMNYMGEKKKPRRRKKKS